MPPSPLHPFVPHNGLVYVVPTRRIVVRRETPGGMVELPGSPAEEARAQRETALIAAFHSLTKVYTPFDSIRMAFLSVDGCIAPEAEATLEALTPRATP